MERDFDLQLFGFEPAGAECMGFVDEFYCDYGFGRDERDGFAD